MAQAEAKAASGKAPKKSGKMKFLLFMILIGIAMPFMLPTVILLLAGLLPTYVAFFTDDDDQKSGAVSVGSMNIAGIVPFIIDLWAKGQTVGNAFEILKDTNSWFVILTASVVGQLIVYTVPPAINILTLAQADSRIKTLRKNIELLKESWGPEVATVRSVEKNNQE